MKEMRIYIEWDRILIKECEILESNCLGVLFSKGVGRGWVFIK